jgi:hypothetical protein
MVQDFTDDNYDPDHVADTDLGNMEDNFTTLKTAFAGPASPPNAIQGMSWFDTVKYVKKFRNAANSAWLGLMHGDIYEKRIVYRSAEMEGYARDSSILDKVVALKGGSTYTNAGATAGNFTFSIEHLHQWYNFVAPSASSQSYNSAGILQSFSGINCVTLTRHIMLSQGVVRVVSGNFFTSKIYGTTTRTIRPEAAVCLLVYLDL